MARPKTKIGAAGAVPLREHIFPKSTIEPMARRWKDLEAAGQKEAAMCLLEEIIPLCNTLFESFAKSEGFTNTAPLQDLVSAAQNRVVKWLLAWDGKRSIHTWFSVCALHAFTSEVKKWAHFKSHIHCVGEDFDKFHGGMDDTIARKGVAEAFERALQDLYCRWGDEQEIGCLRYLAECIVHDYDRHNKTLAINGAMYAWGISPDLAKFFYQWVMSAIRELLYKRVSLPYTEEDLIRCCYSYTNFVDLYDYMGHDDIKRLILTHGGQRIRIPTRAQIAALSENYKVMTEIEDSDMTPDAIASIAKANKKTPLTASQAYARMVEELNPKRTGEYAVFGNGE